MLGILGQVDGDGLGEFPILVCEPAHQISEEKQGDSGLVDMEHLGVGAVDTVGHGQGGEALLALLIAAWTSLTVWACSSSRPPTFVF